MYTIYSTGCPKCRILMTKMEQKGLKYEECQDVSKMESLGIQSLPVLEVDGKLLTFGEAIQFINER